MSNSTTGRTRRRRVAGLRSPGRRFGASHPNDVGDGCDDGLLTVQLLPHFLFAGDLPRVAVGEVLDVTPAVYGGLIEPSRSDEDSWQIDEFGCIRAEGTLVPAMLDPVVCDCRVHVLDAAGRLLPITGEAVDAMDAAELGDGEVTGRLFPGGRVRVEGALYLDPELAPGTEHGNAVSLCRRRYRVRALRRYLRTPWEPVAPVSLAVVPSPGETTAEAVYVADLLALDGSEIAA